MRIFRQRFFRFDDACRIQCPAVCVQPADDGIQAVVIDSVAQQYVYRGIEEVSHLHNQIQFRNRKAGFPFIYGADCHPKHSGQLFLGHFPLFPERTDVF